MDDIPQLFAGGGQVGELMRSHDWSRSPLGPPDTWPKPLRAVVDLLLQSRFPMFVAWGQELGFLYNDPYAEILGAKHPAALGSRFHDIWSEIWPDISPLIDAAMRGHATYREDLPLVMNRKGYDEETWFTFSYSPVRDEAGNIAGMFCACHETTEKVVAERALRRNEEELRDADRRKDEFIAMLAHELRNPLAPVRTGLELIRVAGNSQDAVDQVRSVMERQVAHMVRLIDDLLDVSRITSGKIQLQREPALLSVLLTSAIEANRAAIDRKQIQLTVEIPDAPCVLDVDPTRFVQVMSNLLHNAVKFTPANGQIHVSAGVEPRDGVRPATVILSVTDSGIGIAPDFLPRVFDLFTQGDRASSQPGLGIGLALARWLVEMHGGEIDVRSDGLGRGSQFVIRLSLVDIGMPHVDGYETCRRIRSRYGDTVTLVALTGFGQEQDKERASRAGFDGHLTKPADPTALARLLIECSSAPRDRG